MTPLRVLLLAAYLPGFGHVARTVAAARQLRNRGHTVLFGGSELVASFVAEFGIPFTPIYDVPAAPEAEYRQGIAHLREHRPWRREEPEYVEGSFNSIMSAIDLFRPDLVVFDFKEEAGAAAKLHDIPSISLTDVHGLSWGAWLQDRQLPILERLAGDAARSFYGTAVALQDFPELTPLSMNPSGVARALTYGVSELRFVGPLLLRSLHEVPGRAAMRATLTRPGRTLITVTLGGSNAVFGRVRATLRAMRDVDADLVVVLGPSIRAETLKAEVNALRANNREVTLVATAPSTLQYIAAADLVVGHGGPGTIAEALVSGTPMVHVPSPLGIGGWTYSRRLSELGLGAVLPVTLVQANASRADERKLESEHHEQIERDLPALINRTLEDVAMRARLQSWSIDYRARCERHDLASWVESRAWHWTDVTMQ